MDGTVVSGMVADGTLVDGTVVDGTVVDATVVDATVVDNVAIGGSGVCPSREVGAAWNGARRAAFAASRRALSKGTRSLRWRGIKGVISSAALIG